MDDGAVFYLNGSEIFRQNMPTGPIYFTNLISGAATEGVCLTNTFAVTNLKSGENIISASLHQSDIFSTDMVFGSEMIMTITTGYDLPPPPRPRLTMTRNVPASTLTFSWPTASYGYALQYAKDIEGPWLEAQPMSNPYSMSTTSLTDATFWRLEYKQ